MSLPDVEHVWPPEPTWENVKRLVGGALKHWDRWCPDDGRPKAHFDAIVAFVDADDRDGLQRERAARVVSTMQGAADAAAMAKEAVRNMADQRNLYAPEYIAFLAAHAVKLMGTPTRRDDDDARAARYNEIFNEVGVANLLASLGAIKDENEGEEGGGEDED